MEHLAIKLEFNILLLHLSLDSGSEQLIYNILPQDHYQFYVIGPQDKQSGVVEVFWGGAIQDAVEGQQIYL